MEGGEFTLTKKLSTITDAERGEFNFVHWSDTGYANHDSVQVSCSEIIG